IRDFHVTGVQTCALPIYSWEFGADYDHGFDNGSRFKTLLIVNEENTETLRERYISTTLGGPETKDLYLDRKSRYRERINRSSYRSEERRVGKEVRQQVTK